MAFPPESRRHSGLQAMIVKEFREMKRDKRTLALMIGIPIMMLIIFGYAARFDVTSVDTIIVGPNADQVEPKLPDLFHVVDSDASGDRGSATTALRNGEAAAAVVTGESQPVILLDGADLFSTQSVLAHLPGGVKPEVLFNPNLSTSAVMVPSLIGMILLFVGTVITSLGVVREREQGTLEQLAVMPLRPLDVAIGKIAPYFAIAIFDFIMIAVAGTLLFNVPLRGSIPMLAAYGLVYTFVVLGIGLAISTVSRTQGEAFQLSIMVMLPQIMLSGMIFPLESMAPGVRWIGYALPLTYFVMGARGIFLRDSSIATLLPPLVVLSLMAIVVFGIAIIRFRRELGVKRASTHDHNRHLPHTASASATPHA